MSNDDERGPLGPVASYGSVENQEATIRDNEWKEYESEQQRGAVQAAPSVADRMHWLALKYIILPLALVLWTAQTLTEEKALPDNELVLMLGGWGIYLAMIARWSFRRRRRSMGRR